ncbi:ras guanine nucleotide exchange factor i-related [Anaeramoeba ignava]|uniref:Ras guanine nucleotide exchange factor i-related n=1 Tax=Anaeramoeba ignava TaxID=1746090 RepID=A0A9Q0REC8_ANAIG|nr:ras guanine nucleotide exchange factor i-related [Anaeramoeba ignava]
MTSPQKKFTNPNLSTISRPKNPQIVQLPPKLPPKPQPELFRNSRSNIHFQHFNQKQFRKRPEQKSFKNFNKPIRKEIVMPEKPPVDYEKNPHLLLNNDEQEDRSFWFAKLMENNPEIRNLHERVYPIERAFTFTKTYDLGFNDLFEKITDDDIYQIILQHLSCLGFRKTKETLEKEANIKFEDKHFKESYLLSILRKSVKEIDKVFDIALEEREVAIPRTSNVESDLQNEQENQRKEKTKIIDENADRSQELIQYLVDLGYEDEEEDIEDDIPIWKEPPNSDQNILFMEGPKKEIKAATLNKLVEKLTSEQSDGVKTDTFLMTFPSFTTPKRLFYKLVQRFHVPRAKSLNEEEYLQMKKTIQLKVVNVITKWVEKYFSNFNSQLVQEIKDFIDETLENEDRKLAEKLRAVITKKIGGIGSKKIVYEPPNIPDPIVPKNIFSPTLSIFDVDEEEIARQMTLIDFQLYTKIEPTELLNQSWNKSKYKHKAPNVLAFIQRFNDVSLWVATSVVRQDSLKSRMGVIVKFIKIAYHCKTLHNFNTTMGIYAGLNSTPIYRLKTTWESIKERRIVDMYLEIEEEMSAKSSYKNYRDSLKKVNPPCIPYLGIHLTDLTFIEEGNPDYIGKLIHFAKKKLIYEAIVEIQQYQQKGYDLQPVYQIQQLLLNLKMISEQELYAKSLEIEPRNFVIPSGPSQHND